MGISNEEIDKFLSMQEYLTNIISMAFYCSEIKSKEQTDWHQCNINQVQIIDDMYREKTK